jgi:hypothetical protein
MLIPCLAPSSKGNLHEMAKLYVTRVTSRRARRRCDVRFTPESGHVQCNSVCPLCANSGLMHRSKQHFYSITSSARVSSVGGIVSPSALAVLRLITISNLAGSWTGRSAGLAPLRMRSMYPAA